MESLLALLYLQFVDYQSHLQCAVVMMMQHMPAFCLQQLLLSISELASSVLYHYQCLWLYAHMRHDPLTEG